MKQEQLERVALDEDLQHSENIAQQESAKRLARRANKRRKLRARRTWQMRAMMALFAFLLLGVIVVCSNKTLLREVQKFFDFRENLADVPALLLLSECEAEDIDKIEIVVQSPSYANYTEEKTITDAQEIAAFMESLHYAKLEKVDASANGIAGTADKKETTDGADVDEERTDNANGAENEAQTADDATIVDIFHTDFYTFYSGDTEWIVFTKANDANTLLVDGVWRTVDTKDLPNWYESYLASACAATIRDEVGLVFYPQTWEPSASETDATSYGIDVSYHQGVIDWAQVAQDGVDFAIIRVGVRYAQSGVLEEDVLARYNLQEATKHGIAVGAYLFSTAATEAEVREEAQFTADLLDGYAITYPVVYDCEMFANADNRHSHLTVAERSELADVFLTEIENRGYTGMFYGSKSDLTHNHAWETNWLQSKYHIWVAQYPGTENGPIPNSQSSYMGRHEMWQYTAQATVAGIAGEVDRNISYFSYTEKAVPKGTAAEEVAPDYDALAKMEPIGDFVTAREFVNVRSAMDTTDDTNLLGQLHNGEIVTRISFGANGWSKIEFGDGVGYVVSRLIMVANNEKD